MLNNTWNVIAETSLHRKINSQTTPCFKTAKIVPTHAPVDIVRPKQIGDVKVEPSPPDESITTISELDTISEQNKFERAEEIKNILSDKKKPNEENLNEDCIVDLKTKIVAKMQAVDITIEEIGMLDERLKNLQEELEDMTTRWDYKNKVFEQEQQEIKAKCRIEREIMTIIGKAMFTLYSLASQELAQLTIESVRRDKMRRASLTPMSSFGQEPLIVVEESICLEEQESMIQDSPRRSLDIDSPQNPYLLSPWRDPRETRKHSLPTPSCTSGITASQVRRLSEQGGEGSGPSAREAAFLATLSSTPAPQPGGRRHSVVTISRVPQAFFGRGRRESVAAIPSRGGRGPPATDRRGSSHNLQLDIMDDIVTARKVRMKLWNTSDERVCEVHPLDEGEPRTPQRYTHAGRRFSDFVGCPLPTIPSSRRRASELPPRPPIPPRAKDLIKQPIEGIVCSNTDLISILSSLTSSATEINRCEDKPSKPDFTKKPNSIETRRKQLKNSRSNSFDASVLNKVNQSKNTPADKQVVSPSSWFQKRHQTLAHKKGEENATDFKNNAQFSKEVLRVSSLKKAEMKNPVPKVVWDKPSGSVVDAQVLGSAIEVFLRQSGGPETPPTTLQPVVPSSTLNASQGAIPKTKQEARGPQSGWYGGKSEEEDSAETCDTSLCSTLKDLFVK